MSYSNNKKVANDAPNENSGEEFSENTLHRDVEFFLKCWQDFLETF